ncbi:MAG: amino acid ABC transporter permease [Oscillospiraceae bacterium]
MSSPFALHKWVALFQDIDVFMLGLWMTFRVAVLGLALAMVLGIIFGVFSSSNSKILRTISRIYVEIWQNTPLVIQVFFLYNGLPRVGIVLSVFTIGVIGVGIYHGAYISEVVKTGIQSISKGQHEAAASQGFTYLQTMRYIIIPQSIKIILPPLTNQAVNLIKNTSVLAMIAGGDLMYRCDSWSTTRLFYGPAYVVTGLLYFALTFPLSKLARNLEEKAKNNAPAPVKAKAVKGAVN